MEEESRGFLFDEVVTPRRIMLTGALLVFVSLVALGLSTAGETPEPEWNTDVVSALFMARSQAKSLILLIAPDDCPMCTKIESELTHLTVQQSLKQAICVRAEASQYPQLANLYASSGLPALLIFSPSGGYITPTYTHTGALEALELASVAKVLKTPWQSQVSLK